METSIRLIFCVYSDIKFDFEAISNCLHLMPTRTTTLGEQGKWTTYKDYSWEYDFGEAETPFMDEAMVPFRKAILSRKDELVNALKRDNLKCKLDIVATTRNGVTPGLGLDEQTIKDMAFLSMWVDIDLYVI